MLTFIKQSMAGTIVTSKPNCVKNILNDPLSKLFKNYVGWKKICKNPKNSIISNSKRKDFTQKKKTGGENQYQFSIFLLEKPITYYLPKSANAV